MYKPLVPCPSCKRHVRAEEAACPFCSSEVPQGLAAIAVPSANRRLSRAAAFVFGATVAVSASGCGSTETGGGAGGGEKTTSSASTGPDDDGGVMALYGEPAPDAGPDDDGGAQAEYGAPVPEDGGTDAG